MSKINLECLLTKKQSGYQRPIGFYQKDIGASLKRLLMAKDDT